MVAVEEVAADRLAKIIQPPIITSKFTYSYSFIGYVFLLIRIFNLLLRFYKKPTGQNG